MFNNCWSEDGIIVDADAYNYDEEPNRLEGFKRLPSNTKGDEPDEDTTNVIKNYCGGGILYVGDSE